MAKRTGKSGVEHLAQHPGWKTKRPKRRRGLSAGRERMLRSDAYTQALDDALTAAEGPLTLLLKHFEPSEVQDAFTCHLSTHLGSELINIKEHGHRNDDPDDKPAADTKQEFVDRIARMKTEEEFGDNLPESEDWICTLNSLIEKARAINKR